MNLEIVPDVSKTLHGGVQLLYFFPNGYGASIISHQYSYGGLDGKYELAVLLGTLENYTLTYDSPITDDVVGYLSADEATDLLKQIMALPKASP